MTTTNHELQALLSLSAASSISKGSFRHHFLKLTGVAAIILGFTNIQCGLVLASNESNSISTIAVAEQSSQAVAQAPIQLAQTKGSAPSVVEKQVVVMKVVGFDYFPHRFTVKQGVPVEWWIDASQAAGCGLVIVVPKLRIEKLLSTNSTTRIAFTPQEPGDIEFNCGMGMMTPGSKFVVKSNKKS